MINKASIRNEQDMVNAIRILSIDQVDRANSGHPGLPLGAAGIAYTLFARCMKHSPSNPKWFNRDRFILSAGHGSAMLYSILHLFSYGFEIEDLKNFRQWAGRCHGHPEYNTDLGIEMTTGPLGQGVATAVGIAIAERHLAARLNKDDFSIVDHYTYALCGDGCMMEGISGEAASLAGTLGLGKLIILYDDNGISIDGDTDITFKEDVGARYRAYGWQVLNVDDANDIDKIAEAVTSAKECSDKPSIIIIKSQIAYGSPLVGQAKSHGAPLGKELSQETRKFLNWNETEEFKVPAEIMASYQELTEELNNNSVKWDKLRAEYTNKYPQEADLLSKLIDGYSYNYFADDNFFEAEDKSIATRESSFMALNRIAERDPLFIGGSADLAGSNKTELKNSSYMSANDYFGRNIHFGVREHAMAAVANGLALHGLHPFCATFLVFSDYARGAMRLSALMKLPVQYVFTHDSIGVGEDGPTHEPIEHLSNLRAIPDLYTFRPADSRETLYAYATAASKNLTAVHCFSRSGTGVIKGTGRGTEKGVYILRDNTASGELPDLIMMASGSELQLADKAYEELSAKGVKVRLLSCPCLELFDEQSPEYKEQVLPSKIRKRLAIEAGSAQSWYKYTGLDGKHICIDRYGDSAPASRLFEEFGFTKENIVKTAEDLLCL